MRDHTDDMAAVTGRGLIVVLGLLAGCGSVSERPVAGGVAQSQSAILYRDTVNVQFSDGALCVGPRPAGARGWSGRLAGCAHPLAYEVTLPEGPLAARRVLVRLDGGGAAVLSLDGARFGLPGPV